MFGKIFSPATGHLCDKSCTSPLAQRKRKRNRFPFIAVFKLYICHGKDVTKAAKALSSKPPLPSAFPQHPKCHHFASTHFQATITSTGLILPPTAVRVQSRRTVPYFGGPQAASSAAATRQQVRALREEPEARLRREAVAIPTSGMRTL